MNKDINIVLTEAETVATAVDFRDGLGRVLKTADVIYTFPWKKVGAVLRNNGAAEVAAQVTVDVTGSVAGDEYFFYLTQSIDGEIKQQRISVLGQSTDQLTSDAIVSAIETIAGAGGGSLLKASADNAGGTVTLVTIDSDAGYPLLSISNASSGVLTLATVTPGEAAINAGADLAALGVVDSFDSSVIPTAALYNEYTFELMAPKGSGGFNEQTNDQKVLLKVYADQASLTSAALDAVIDSIIDGSYTAAELLGSNV